MFGTSGSRRWHLTRLKYCIESVSNGAWGKDPGEDEIDVVCIRVADFRWPQLDIDYSNPTIRSIAHLQYRKLSLRSGDILLEKSGGGEKTPVGRTAMFKGGLGAVTSNFIGRVRASQTVEPRFLLYLLASLYETGQTSQFIKQNTGIQNLDDRALLTTLVRVPIISAQKRIADFLDRQTSRIDELIEKKQRLVELLEEKKGLAIRTETTFSGGLAGGQPRVPLVKLKWLPTRSNAGEVIPRNFWGSGDEFLYTCSRNPMYSNYDGFPAWKRTSLNDLLLTRNGTPYVFLPRPGSIYSNVVQRITIPQHHPPYIKYALDSKIAEFRGYGVSIESLNYQMWGNIRVPLPDLGTQKAVVNVIERRLSWINSIRNKTNESIERLRELRSALITAAVTGQIDVDEWERRGGTERELERLEEEGEQTEVNQG